MQESGWVGGWEGAAVTAAYLLVYNPSLAPGGSLKSPPSDCSSSQDRGNLHFLPFPVTMNGEEEITTVWGESSDAQSQILFLLYLQMLMFEGKKYLIC